MLGELFVVATPLGNLQDLSDRAKKIFGHVTAVICEDTRVTAKLLANLNVRPTLISYHQHSDQKRVEEILVRLQNGEDLALVTDAGTPGISDPGGQLVWAVVKRFGNEARITPIPGPNAAIAALSVSGFPTDKFVFFGFPPQKNGRRKYFQALAETEATVVFYESKHRILKSLTEMAELLPDRPTIVARELTKMHETIYRGACVSVLEQLKSTSNKGEFVIVVRAK